jgi:uncharacterized cupredoxin-like copper-binding protein
MGVIATSIVGSVALGSGSLVAVAQDASPSPMGECVPGEMSTEMIASPTADMASPAADAEAPAEPVGTPADDATTEAATAFVENLKACVNDPDAVATLVTANLVNSLGGYGSVDEALADGFFTELPFAEAEVQKVTSYDNGAVGVEVQYMQSQYQVVAEEWWLVQENGAWKFNALENETADVDGDTAAVGVALLENEDGTYAITPNAPSVVQPEVLILQGNSAATNQEPHELVVLQLPEGADPMGLLDGSIQEEDITFIGVVFGIQPGGSADLTLVGLPAGEYVLACFIPGPDGAPHADHGMIAPFEITAPEPVASPEA